MMMMMLFMQIVVLTNLVVIVVTITFTTTTDLSKIDPRMIVLTTPILLKFIIITTIKIIQKQQ